MQNNVWKECAGNAITSDNQSNGFPIRLTEFEWKFRSYLESKSFLIHIHGWKLSIGLEHFDAQKIYFYGHY